MKTDKEQKENRRNPRIKTANLVNYELLDQDNRPIGKGRGKAINLSVSGLLLKTDTPLQGVFVVLMTIDLEGNEVKVRGRLIHSTPDESGGFFSGIEFKGPKDKQIDVIVSFVKTYQQMRHRMKNL